MNIEVANRLVNLRKQYGLSQEQLAEKIGVSRQAVSKWERSEASPDTDNLILLARLYNVSLDELLSTEDEIPAGNNDSEEAGAQTDCFGAEPEQENEASEGRDFVGENGDKVHIGFGGIHVSARNGDEVHVGWDGIHVNEHRGDRVNIDRNGIHVEECGGDNVSVDENGVFVNGEHKDIGEEFKRGVRYGAPIALTGIIAFLGLGIFMNGWAWCWLTLLLVPFFISIVDTIVKRKIKKLDGAVFFGSLTGFLGTGMFVADAWSWCWLILLLIPILSSAIDAVKKRKLSHFCFPVLVTLGFLISGMFYNMWHPMWVVFLTIPLFYWICSMIERK